MPTADNDDFTEKAEFLKLPFRHEEHSKPGLVKGKAGKDPHKNNASQFNGLAFSQ